MLTLSTQSRDLEAYQGGSGYSFSKVLSRFVTPELFSSAYQTVRSYVDCQKLHKKLTDAVPPTARWLSEKEKAFVQARLPPNAPRAQELNFNLREIFTSLKDLRLWMFTLIWATQTVGTQGIQFYQATVIADLGFT